MTNLIQCDKCKNVISSDRIKVYDKTIKPGTEARLWKCPHCKHKHLVTVIDKAVRRIMETIKKDRRKIGNINKKARSGVMNLEQMKYNLNRVDKLNEEIDKRTKKLDKRMKGLINEYKEEV